MTENNQNKNKVVGEVASDNSLQKIQTEKSDVRRVVVLDEKIVLKPADVLDRK